MFSQPISQSDIIAEVRKVGRLFEVTFTSSQEAGNRYAKLAREISDGSRIRRIIQIRYDRVSRSGFSDQLQCLSRLGAARIVIDGDSHFFLGECSDLKQSELYQAAPVSSAAIFVLDGEPRMLVVLTGFSHKK
jgi:hypothetical protein